MARLPWFEDFNDHASRPPPAAEEPQPPPDDGPDPRIEAWTEGFLAGCRAGDADKLRQSQAAAAELTSRVAGIEDTLAAIADQSAATMGLLLLDVLAAALPPDWPADRLAGIVAAIRPIFALEPRLHISPAAGGELTLRDLPMLAEAMLGGNRELLIRWHSAGADTDPAELAGAVRRAIGPGESRALPDAGRAKSVPPSPDEG